MKRKTVKMLALFTLICVLAAGASTVYAAQVSSVEYYNSYVISSKKNTNQAIDIPWSNVNNAPNLFSKDYSKANQRWMPGRLGSYALVYATMTVGTSSQVVMYADGSGKIRLAEESLPAPSRKRIDFHNLGGSYFRMYFPDLGQYMSVEYGLLENSLKIEAYSEASDSQKWYIEL